MKDLVKKNKMTISTRKFIIKNIYFKHFNILMCIIFENEIKIEEVYSHQKKQDNEDIST